MMAVSTMPGAISRETTCRSCGAPIVFVRLQSGGLIPCDANSRQLVREARKGTSWVTSTGTVIYGVPGTNGVLAYRSHFATCPYATQTGAVIRGVPETAAQHTRR